MFGRSSAGVDGPRLNGTLTGWNGTRTHRPESKPKSTRACRRIAATGPGSLRGRGSQWRLRPSWGPASLLDRDLHRAQRGVDGPFGEGGQFAAVLRAARGDLRADVDLQH